MTGIMGFYTPLELLETNETCEQQRKKIWDHVDFKC